MVGAFNRDDQRRVRAGSDAGHESASHWCRCDRRLARLAARTPGPCRCASWRAVSTSLSARSTRVLRQRRRGPRGRNEDGMHAASKARRRPCAWMANATVAAGRRTGAPPAARDSDIEAMLACCASRRTTRCPAERARRRARWGGDYAQAMSTLRRAAIADPRWRRASCVRLRSASGSNSASSISICCM